MRRRSFTFSTTLLWILLSMIGLQIQASAAPAKSHVIGFGKWITVKYSGANDQAPPETLKVRPLLVDGRIKEYTFGPAHDVTERVFATQRAFRLNDSLPEDSGTPRWQWQRGGWLLVDRLTGHVSAINLAEFDSNYSTASWYRDYVAYCGISDDGKKISAVVMQLSRRKPVLKKLLSEESANKEAIAESACGSPIWQRAPMRVSFEASSGVRQTFAVRGRAADLVIDADDEEAEK